MHIIPTIPITCTHRLTTITINTAPHLMLRTVQPLPTTNMTDRASLLVESLSPLLMVPRRRILDRVRDRRGPTFLCTTCHTI